jgi:hypothetical protein
VVTTNILVVESRERNFISFGSNHLHCINNIILYLSAPCRWRDNSAEKFRGHVTDCVHKLQNSVFMLQELFSIILTALCIGVKLGRSHCKRNRVWGSSRIGRWGGYLSLREKTYHELNDLYYSPNIIWVIKSTIMRWVARGMFGGEERWFWWEP